MMLVSPTLLLASLSVLSATQANAIPVRNSDGIPSAIPLCNMYAQPEATDSCATYWSKQPAPTSDLVTSSSPIQTNPEGSLEARALTRRFEPIENGIAFGDYTTNAVMTIVQSLVYAYGNSRLHPPVGITSAFNLAARAADFRNILDIAGVQYDGIFSVGGVKFWFTINSSESQTPLYLVKTLIGPDILASIFADAMEGIAHTDNQSVAMALWQKGRVFARLAMGTY